VKCADVQPLARLAVTTLRNVAVNVRNAASFAGALTFGCNITFDVPSVGSFCAIPISNSPAGAIRRARGATASPARDHGGETAADKGFAPGNAPANQRWPQCAVDSIISLY
jgi:hypothetical protein